MSMISLCRRTVLTSTRMRQPSIFATCIRLNSSSSSSSSSPPTPPASKDNFSLLTQIYPINKESVNESDIDEWLSAVKKLKRNNSRNVETPEEVYLQTLTQQPETFLNESFEPTEEQLAQVELINGEPVPLFNHPIIENFVCLMMKDGKKSKYQKILNRALYIIYLKKRQDPVQLLSETLDKLGPLMASRTEKTGTAKNRLVPYPLNQRQRNRYAIKWILDGATKKKSSDYSVRLAEEIMSAHEGKSSGYERKAQMHKAAIQQRAYIKL